jgi:hypothetical protein
MLLGLYVWTMMVVRADMITMTSFKFWPPSVTCLYTSFDLWKGFGPVQRTIQHRLCQYDSCISKGGLL